MLEGQLEGLDDAFHLLIPLKPVELAAVHGLDQVDARTLHLLGKGGVGQVANGGLVRGGADVLNRGSLVDGGKEGAAVVALTPRGRIVM